MTAMIQGSNFQVDKFRNSTGYTPRPAPIALNLVKKILNVHQNLNPRAQVKPSLPDIVLPIIGRGEPQSSPILPSGSPADFTRSPPPQKSNGPLTRLFYVSQYLSVWTFLMDHI